jgi:hypothetical protein
MTKSVLSLVIISLLEMDLSVSEIATAIIGVVVSCVLLMYPIKTGEVHPYLQMVICTCLSAIGLYLGLTGLAEPSIWVTLASVSLALCTVIVPAVGALIGLATASGLIVNAICSNFFSESLNFWLVVLGASAGASSLIIDRAMFLIWQLIAPPIVGGYVLSASLNVTNPVVYYGIWCVSALLSLGLHMRRRRYNTWLERKKELAVHSKESQIVSVMRSANPDMQPDDFEKLKERLLGAVGGDREQVDRIVFGGGLY